MTLRPSNAIRWANCAGSFQLESFFPDEESAEAREGTAGHFFATEYLKGLEYPVGYITPNGVPIDADMIEAGHVLISDVMRVFAPRQHSARLYVERMVYPHGLINPLCEGTPDVVMIDYHGRYIHIWDFKYGHKYVEVWGMLQCLLYLAGVVEGIELTAEDLASWTVIITVVQPRYYAAPPVRHWQPRPAEIQQWFTWLEQRAEAALQPNAPCQTGPWCTNCKARHSCEALAKAGGVAVEMSGQSLPLVMDAAQVSRQLRSTEDALERLEALLTGLAAFAENEIRQGRRVPGYELRPSSNKEDWTQPVPEIIAMGDSFGVDLRKPVDAVTPTQARKKGLDTAATKAGLDGGVTPLYAKRKPGALKLSRVDPNAAAKAFS